MATQRRPIVLIGNTLHELSDSDTLANFYNKIEIDSMLGNVSAGAIDIDYVMSKLSVYTKSELNTILGTKANVADVYSKTEALNLINKKAPVESVYTKSETYSKMETYSRLETFNRQELYSRIEIDDLLVNFGAITIDDVYTKTEINTMFSGMPSLSSLATDTELNSLKLQMREEVSLTYLKKTDATDFITRSYADQNFTTLTNTYTRTEIDGKITALNLSTYATQDWVNSKLLDILTGAGSVTIDLSNYYTRVQTQDMIDSKVATALSAYTPSTPVDLTNYYTKTGTQAYVSDAFTTQLTSYYNKSSVDAKFLDYYTKSEVNSKLVFDATLYYTREDTNTLVSGSINAAIAGLNLSTYATKSDTYTKAELYTRTELDQILSGISSGTGGGVDLTYVYTKTEVNALIADLATLEDVDNKVAAIQATSGSYTKLESDDRYYNKADVYTKAMLYTKADVDGLLNTFKTTNINPLLQADITLDNRLKAVEAVTSSAATTTAISDATTPIKLDVYKLIQKATRVKDKLKINPKLTERDLITVSNAATKTYNVEYNPDFVQVYVNRNLLYKDEYTATNGTSITFIIDLYKSAKIKVFTS